MQLCDVPWHPRVSKAFVRFSRWSGGFYEETTENYFLPSQTWMSQFVVSYSNDGSSFSFYRTSFGTLEVRGSRVRESRKEASLTAAQTRNVIIIPCERPAKLAYLCVFIGSPTRGV